MANRVFKRNFSSDFKGIDAEMSSLETDGSDVNRAVNLECSIGNSIRGRVGCQVASSPGYGFYGLFPYTYTRTQDQYDISYQTQSGVYPNQTPTISTVRTAADGANISKLVTIGTAAWVMDTMNIVVTYVSGSYPFTWYTYVNGAAINFVIKANGVTLLDTSLNDGISSNVTIYSLLGSIDALAELSVSRTTRSVCPPFAIVNGNQVTTLIGSATYGNRYQVTVNAGHTFYPGDVITLYDSTVGQMISGIVISRGATTIDYVGEQISLTNGRVLGYMGQSATSFPIDIVQSASSGNLTISFPYLRWIPDGGPSDSLEYGTSTSQGIRSWAQRAWNSFYAPPTATSAAGCLYIARSEEADPDKPDQILTNMAKIDNACLTRVGLPAPTAAPTVTAPGAGALTGNYKYKMFYRRIDAQGNIIEGPVSAVKSITLAANYSAITAVAPDKYNLTYSGFAVRSCYKYTAESPAAGAFFYVDDNTAAPGLNAFIQPGDPLVLLDNVAQKVGLWKNAFGVDALGTVTRTVCSGYDGSTVPSSIQTTLDAAITIPNNQEISAGLTVVVLRTAAGGNQYYVLAELPVTGYADVSFFDNVTDAVLTAGEQYTEVTLGKEHNPPPPCSLVTQHQGGLVVARGMLTPSTVSFSTAEGIEYFPTASNSFDVPSTVSGYITAIVSDTNDRLAVFKERAYYDVVGDLDGGTFSINVKNEGDYGITSQASLVRMPDGLVGLSKNGYIRIYDGQLDPYRFSSLNARLINQDYLFGSAIAVNDYVNRSYVCAIPVAPSVTGAYSTSYVSHVIDYSRTNNNSSTAYGAAVKTFERSYPVNIDQSGGMAVIDEQMYHLSGLSTSELTLPPTNIFRRLRRFDGNSPGSGDGDSFVDNTQAISYILESQVLNLGEPSLLKSPIRLRLWSLPNDYIKEGWVTFSSLVETGSSPVASFIGSTNPLATSSTVTFATESDVFKDVKLTTGKTHFLIVRFTTNTIRTSPFLTGYEINFSANYDKDDFIK